MIQPNQTSRACTATPAWYMVSMYLYLRHGFFNRERILHCKPAFTLVHVRELLHLRHSLDSNTALGFASCIYWPLNCASRAIIHVQYSQRCFTNTCRLSVGITLNFNFTFCRMLALTLQWLCVMAQYTHC